MSTVSQYTHTPAADQFAAITRAFPKRRMTILASGKQGVLVALGLGFACLLMLLGLLYMTVPDLIYDYKVSKDPVLDTQAEIHGSCKTRKVIFVDCDVKIKYLPTPQDTVAKEIKHSFWFVSFEPSMSTDAIRSRTDPGMITTTIAVEHMTNRFFMILSFTVLFGGLFIGSLFSARQTYAFNRIAKEKPELQPVLAKVTHIQNERVVRFETTIDGVTKKRSHIMRKKEGPLFLPNRADMVLAVAVKGSKHVILMNEDLTSLDFTEQEKTALRNAMTV